MITDQIKVGINANEIYLNYLQKLKEENVFLEGL